MNRIKSLRRSRRREAKNAPPLSATSTDAERVSAKYWTAPRKRHNSLTFEVAAVSVGRRVSAAGIRSNIPNRITADFPPVAGHGTPAGLAAPKTPLSPHPPPTTDRIIPLNTPALEALEDFTPNLDLSTRTCVHTLAAALISHVEQKNLLPGWASPVVAVACMTFAYIALLRVHKDVDERFVWLAEYGVCSDSVRTGYNALWLVRKDLREAVEAHGGETTVLDEPLTMKGRPQEWLLMLDRSGKNWQPRHVDLVERTFGTKRARKESPLQRVEVSDVEAAMEQEESEREDEKHERREFIARFKALNRIGG